MIKPDPDGTPPPSSPVVEEHCQVISLDHSVSERDIAGVIKWHKPGRLQRFTFGAPSEVFYSKDRFVCFAGGIAVEHRGHWLKQSANFHPESTFTILDDGTTVFFQLDGELIAKGRSFKELWRVDVEEQRNLAGSWGDYPRSRGQRVFAMPGNQVLVTRPRRSTPSGSGWARIYSKQGELVTANKFACGHRIFAGKDGRFYTSGDLIIPGGTTETFMAYNPQIEPLYRCNLNTILFSGKHSGYFSDRYTSVTGNADGSLVMCCSTSGQVLGGTRPGGRSGRISLVETIPNPPGLVWALNADGTPRWHYKCKPRDEAPTVADDGTVYIVNKEDDSKSSILQISTEGVLLRKVHTKGEIGRLHLLDGGQRIAFVLNTSTHPQTAGVTGVPLHLVVLNSEMTLLKSLRFPSLYPVEEQRIDSFLGDNNTMYIMNTCNPINVICTKPI